MKIYGDYTFLLDKLNVWNNSQVKVFQNGTKIVEFADHIRDQMSDLSASKGGAPASDSSFTKLTGDGLSLMDGLCRTYILQRLDCPGEDGVSAKMYNEMSAKYKEKMSADGGSDLSSISCRA